MSSTSKRLDEALAKVKSALPGVELWLEPGRYFVANAGVLLARVTQTKVKSGIRYVGVATGMNSLIRPALYGAHHDIVNLTRYGEPANVSANVVGPICESSDFLGHDRLLPECHSGDVLLIATAGAYGRAMSSQLQPARAGRGIAAAVRIHQHVGCRHRVVVARPRR